jgi:flavin-binding protein dodecin
MAEPNGSSNNSLTAAIQSCLEATKDTFLAAQWLNADRQTEEVVSTNLV